TLSGDGKNAEITIIQNPLTGKAYIVNISSIAWEESSVYNIMASGEKVGEICKEYIYKYDDVNAIPVVRGSMMIAYPMNISGNVDYANGYVIDNGGSIIWNTAVTVETAGNEMIAQYNPGSLTVTPSTIYFPDGASSFTHIQMGAEDMASAITADTEPMLLVDVKSGEANTAGETTETITYGVVKIGRNYWLNTNYASSRYADGSNIPTNIANAQWTNISNPGCLVSGTSSTNTYLDANSSNATTTRRTYGCLYNWQALTGAVILPDQTTETDRKSDIISPEGWSVPSKDDYTIMRNYITQGSPNPTTDPLNECYTTATTTYANITGFNGLGTRSRGYKSGGYNTGTYYWTIDYTFKGSNTAGTQDGHMGYILSLNKSTNITTIGVSTGCYLRLIKD
ncbi:MAG: FISUMP domain-containing protein, partial [Bacteroidales bacterium]|nr:FISUMP domain-containing protein [Bacteroidales bacterium]